MILAHIRLIEMSHCHSYHDIFYNYFMMSFLVFVSLSMTWGCTRDRFIVAHFCSTSDVRVDITKINFHVI